MDEKLCPFVNVLLAGEHACQYAQHVTRRSGPAVLSHDDEAFARCSAVHDRARAAALPAMGYEDDLLSVPHSMLVKVQFGTLLGLQQLRRSGTDNLGPIGDLAALVTAAADDAGGVTAIPYATLVESIEHYRLPRRRARG